jgi:ABC-type glycerol-3-phosphate transport system substrate-binding protein
MMKRSGLSAFGMALSLLCAMALGSALTAVAFAGVQPGMSSAHDSLAQTITYLTAAQRDQRGYRDNALDLCRQALHEIELGISAENGHEN